MLAWPRGAVVHVPTRQIAETLGNLSWSPLHRRSRHWKVLTTLEEKTWHRRRFIPKISPVMIGLVGMALWARRKYLADSSASIAILNCKLSGEIRDSARHFQDHCYTVGANLTPLRKLRATLRYEPLRETSHCGHPPQTAQRRPGRLHAQTARCHRQSRQASPSIRPAESFRASADCRYSFHCCRLKPYCSA